MARPETSILRGVVAGLYERIDALEKKVTSRDELIERLLARVAELESEVRRLSGRNRAYEGPHAFPSVSSIGRGRKSRPRAGGGPPAEPAVKPGPPEGHPGLSQSNRLEETVVRRAGKCGNCGSTRLADVQAVESKQEMDAEIRVGIKHTNVLTVKSKCLGCNQTCVPERDARDIRNTWFGPGLASCIALLHLYHLSAGTIKRALEEILGVGVGETAVKKCIRVSGAKLGPPAGRIRKSVKGMSHVHIDETTFGRGGAGGRQLWGWVAVGVLKDGSVGAVIHDVAESMLWHTVIDRRIRNTMRTTWGRRTLGTLLTCTETWRAKGLNVAETLRRALVGEAVPCA